MSRDVSYIVKITNDCNMGCPYCYHFKNNGNAKNLYMTEDILHQTIKSLIEHNKHNAHFIWHGGEPLLQSIDVFTRIIEWQKSLCKPSMNITNAIQTNGTLLDKRWIDFFVENDFHIGLSIDGYKDLHIRSRQVEDNVFDLLMEKIAILNKSKARFGVLTVVGKNTIPHAKEMLAFFIENGINDVGFLPAVVQQKGNLNYEQTVTPEEYGKFLVALFDEWIKCGKTGMSFREFDEYFRGRIGIRHRLCTNSNECDRYFTVTPQGEIYLCDCFPFNESTYIGTVDQNLKKVLSRNESLKELKRKGAELPSECTSCQYRKMCNGGCKYYRWLADCDLKKPHYFCSSFKKLYLHMDETINRMEV